MYVHLHTNSSHFRNEQVYSITPASDRLYRKAYRILLHSHTNRMKGLYGAGSVFPSGNFPAQNPHESILLHMYDMHVAY